MTGILSMDRERILITGSGGFIGSNLYRVLKEKSFDVFGVDIKSNETVDYVCDISDRKQIEDYLEQIKPNKIVHFSAFSNVEKCETEKDYAYKSNVIATKNLCDYCRRHNCMVVYISTDYVFDGVDGNYSESSPTNPIQYYGVTKLEGEKLVAKLKRFIILRPTVVFGWDPMGMNFFMQVMRKLKAGQELYVPDDQISNPTYVLDLCQAITRIIALPPGNGIFLSTGPVAYSRFNFAKIIAKEFSLNEKLIIPKKTSEMSQIAKRPLNNSTNSSLLYGSIGYTFESLSDNFRSIREMMQKII
jgi:dTDP-4-dehydrorhamnose reductase